MYSVLCAQGETIKRQLEPLVEPFVQRLELLNINVTQFELPHGVRLPAVFRQDNPPRPGRELRKRGLAPKHPVIIVPGFVTSGLELWHGVECAIPKYFRCSPNPKPCIPARATWDLRGTKQLGRAWLWSAWPCCRPCCSVLFRENMQNMQAVRPARPGLAA